MIEITVILVVVGIVWFFFFREKKSKTETESNTEYTYSKQETELIDLINSYRENLNLSTLKINNGVSCVCQDHNMQMLRFNEVSHNGFEGRADEIINKLGAKSVAENIAYNYLSAKAVIDAWVRSSSHKENLENHKWTQLGTSIVGSHVTTIFIC